MNNSNPANSKNSNQIQDKTKRATIVHHTNELLDKIQNYISRNFVDTSKSAESSHNSENKSDTSNNVSDFKLQTEMAQKHLDTDINKADNKAQDSTTESANDTFQKNGYTSPFSASWRKNNGTFLNDDIITTPIKKSQNDWRNKQNIFTKKIGHSVYHDPKFHSDSDTIDVDLLKLFNHQKVSGGDEWVTLEYALKGNALVQSKREVEAKDTTEDAKNATNITPQEVKVKGKFVYSLSDVNLLSFFDKQEAELDKSTQNGIESIINRKIVTDIFSPTEAADDKSLDSLYCCMKAYDKRSEDFKIQRDKAIISITEPTSDTLTPAMLLYYASTNLTLHTSKKYVCFISQSLYATLVKFQIEQDPNCESDLSKQLLQQKLGNYINIYPLKYLYSKDDAKSDLIFIGDPKTFSIVIFEELVLRHGVNIPTMLQNYIGYETIGTYFGGEDRGRDFKCFEINKKKSS